MPFSLTEASSIGDVALTADGTDDGRPCDMEGDAGFFRLIDEPYVQEVTAGLDNSQAVAAVARNLAGVFGLTLSWAPAEVRSGLRELVGGGRVSFVAKHPALDDGTLTLDVEVLAVRPANDTSQYEATDPVEGLFVQLVSHGEADA